MMVLGRQKMECFISISIFIISSLEALPSKCFLLPASKSVECINHSVKHSMKRRHLTDSSIQCNDGSNAGYYLRKNENSKVWLVYLEGGWFCYDEVTCVNRMNQSNELYSMTSSKLWSKWRQGDGLLSSNKRANPSFWNANHVYIPYCSSDFWIGNVKQATKTGATISFHGRKILRSVISSIMNTGLKNGDSLILAGSSAGGIGVLQNIDNIAKMVNKVMSIKVRGIIDSAWFIDNGLSTNCVPGNGFDCQPQLLFKLAIKYWKGVLHTPCFKAMKPLRHNCLFAHNIINSIKSPVFVFQWIYDSAQILADNKELVDHPEKMVQEKYKNYVTELGKKMKFSLQNINGKHGMFAPSCLSHTALTTTLMFDNILLGKKSLNDAIKCWLLKNHNKTNGETNTCNYRFIDKCDMIKCHNSCPVIHDPISGQPIYESHITSTDTSIPVDLATYDLELIDKVLNELSTG